MFNNSLQMFSKVVITSVLLVNLFSRFHCDESPNGNVSTLIDPAHVATEEGSSESPSRMLASLGPSQENWNGDVRLPEEPESLSAAKDATCLLDLWEFRLNQMDEELQRTSYHEPNIIIVMNSEEMKKLIPEIKRNPLYYTKNRLMADNFILDSLSTERINWIQNETASPQGLLIKSMNGKALIFKGNGYSSTISINGVEVLSHETLPDEKEVFILSHYLFGYEKHIKKALRDLQNSEAGNNNNNNNNISDPILIGKLCYNSFPEIPKIGLQEFVIPNKTHVGSESFLQVWAYHITQTKFRNKENSTCSVAPEYEINTIVAVDNEKMKSSIPHEKWENPLYLPQYEELIDHFILDSISADTLNLSDTHLLRPEGITLRSLSGVDLNFKKDQTSGILSVNGNRVLDAKGMENGTKIFVIDNFLFTHLEDTQYAYDMNKRTNSQDPNNLQLTTQAKPISL